MLTLPSRRQFLTSLPPAFAGLFLSQCSTPPPPTVSESEPSFNQGRYQGRLAWNTVFRGETRFQELCDQAERGHWASLPLGERTAKVGQALLGTPYGNYTLEIDDHVEAPSVNLNELDCWTFYETSLAFARMIRSSPAPWTGKDMLHYVELERYRNGHCDGTYLSRMHHLEEVFANNEHRGLGKNMTRSLGGVPIHRNIHEMQVAWRHYRYLAADPSLIPGIARVEARVSSLPVTYVPKHRVPSIESELQDGDVLAIASADTSGYTSHVGMALRKGSTCHFMHATSSYDKGRRCIVDARISHYLGERSDHIGLIVFRPYDVV